MKKLGLILLGLVAAWGLLSWPVTTRRGVNYEVATSRIPLGLKALTFLSRDAQYRHLVRTLVGHLQDHEASIMTLFEWTRGNIRPIPSGFPIIDDHVWDIIVRGYGTQDQAADVFATLCAYAGIPAHFQLVEVPETHKRLGVAFVEVAPGRFGVFDPAHGVAVRHPDGRLASMEEIREDRSLIERAASGLVLLGEPYWHYFEVMPQIRPGMRSRTTEQVPLRRLGTFLRGG